MSRFQKSLMTFSALTALTAFSSLAAVAQEQIAAGPAQDAAAPDRVVVTGSRIARSNESAAIPVQVISRDDIDEVGTVSVGEILTELPGVDFDLSPESTGLSTQNAGLSTINLRRMGGNRTLTLIDGRRAISNSGNGESVSLNTIPAGFVRSIEVTTGGASAIYGSDAIAGVVNILLKDTFEGLDVNVRYGEAERSGEREKTIDLTYGANFADDRGHVLLGFTYNDEGAIYADATRPESIAALEWNAPNTGTFIDETGFGDCDASGRFCFNPTGSSSLPGGLFETDDAWNIGGVWFNDMSLLPADGRTGAIGYEIDVDGYNLRPDRTISPAMESFLGAVKLDFDIADNMSLFFNASYSDVNTLSRNAALTGASTTDIGFNNALGDIGQISGTHPFIPPEVEETRVGTVAWNRRFNEVGFRDKDNSRKTLRTAFGLEGETSSNWDWSLYGTYGTFDQVQVHINELNLLNVRNALTVQSNGSGGYQCVDAAARADGCVPLNIFGEGAITPEMAAYIRYTGRLDQERTQTTFGGTMNGDLFSLPAGVVKTAFGLEYRKEEQTTVGDPDSLFELTTITHIPDIKADFDVTEIFGELDIPLLRDKASLQLALRAADYSTVGDVLSYNIGGSWQPVSDIRFRAQYSRSQRAPTLTEFFSPPRGDADDLRDPCTGLNPDGSGITLSSGSTADVAVVSANCLSETGIQAFFADPGNAGLPFTFDGSVSGPNAGNTNLKEETADTFTAGFVFTPSVVPNLSLIVDYYNITVEDAIGSIETQLTADLCYSDPGFPSNRFCDVITRDASSGRVNQVINQVENLNELTVEGIDATINYDWSWAAVPGDFRLNLVYTHYLSDEFIFPSLSGPQVEDSLGEIGAPENEYRVKLGWSNAGFRTTYTVRYREGGVDDINVLAGANDYFKVGGEAYHNIYAEYAFHDRPDIKIYGGVNNLFDDLGPLLPDGLNYGDTRNITSSLNDVEGREFYAGLKLRW